MPASTTQNDSSNPTHGHTTSRSPRLHACQSSQVSISANGGRRAGSWDGDCSSGGAGVCTILSTSPQGDRSFPFVLGESTLQAGINRADLRLALPPQNVADLDRGLKREG